ncbi:cytochrome b562 [Vibrio sp. WXL103]|uniref:cytochrome b562 n=1 Tax=unclassified Vibrio TaxID=2614977 RepID=UPI003EC7E6C0
MEKLIMLRALMLTLLFVSGHAAADFDLKANMQEMRLSFKQAAEASSVETMRASVNQLNELIKASQRADYPEEKQQHYLEGFARLTAVIEEVNAHLDADDLDQAQHSLRQVDALRIEYHEKRNPSIWRRLFG